MSEPPTIDDIRSGYERDAALREENERLRAALDAANAREQAELTRAVKLAMELNAANARAEDAEQASRLKGALALELTGEREAAKVSMAPLMAKCANLLAERDAAVSMIRRYGEVLAEAGYPMGDRDQTMRHLVALVRDSDAARKAHDAERSSRIYWQNAYDTMWKERDAALARAEARDENNPAAQALDDLWKGIILKRNPDYGDWEYPGQAYRHLLAEFDDALKRESAARAEADALDEKLAGLLCRLTNGRYSKTSYSLDTMVQMVEETEEEHTQEAIKEATDAARAEAGALRERLEDCLLKDRGKTREINVLVPEVKAAVAEAARYRAALEGMATSDSTDVWAYRNTATRALAGEVDRG